MIKVISPGPVKSALRK